MLSKVKATEIFSQYYAHWIRVRLGKLCFPRPRSAKPSSVFYSSPPSLPPSRRQGGGRRSKLATARLSAG